MQIGFKRAPTIDRGRIPEVGVGRKDELGGSLGSNLARVSPIALKRIAGTRCGGQRSADVGDLEWYRLKALLYCDLASRQYVPRRGLQWGQIPAPSRWMAARNSTR
jgi:hypothetical protein